MRYVGQTMVGWLRVAGMGAICAAALWSAAVWFSDPERAEAGQAAASGPRLSVDRELIDFGPVRYRQYVEARFRLKNVGDQPLQLPASPPVEVVEGC